MALFFDHAWFDAELAKRHLRRDDVASMLGLSPVEISEIWKDQRELKAADVAILAALLNMAPQIIADRAGISTPVPKAAPLPSDAIEKRLSAIEAKLDAILKKLG